MSKLIDTLSIGLNRDLLRKVCTAANADELSSVVDDDLAIGECARMTPESNSHLLSQLSIVAIDE